MKESVVQYHKKLENIFFPVIKVTIQELYPDTQFANNLTHAIHIPEKNKTVHICPKSYHLVDNERLIAPVVDKLNQVFGPNGYQTTVKSYDDRKFYVSFTINQEIYKIMGNDSVFPMIEVKNSYDGTIKQSASLSFYRLICRNGMMGFSHEYSLSKKHTQEDGELNLDPIFKDLKRIDTRITRFKHMTDRRVTPDELIQITETIRKSRTIEYPTKLVDQAPLIAQKEAAELQQPLNSWLVYNGFNNILYHSRGKLLPERREKIDQKVLQTLESILEL